MLKKLIGLIVAIVILGFGVYIHLEPLSSLYALAALVALIICIVFRKYIFKNAFLLVGLVHFAYLLRYIWSHVWPFLQGILP